MRGNVTDVMSSQAGTGARVLLSMGKHKEMGRLERQQRYLTGSTLANIFPSLSHVTAELKFILITKGFLYALLGT